MAEGAQPLLASPPTGKALVIEDASVHKPVAVPAAAPYGYAQPGYVPYPAQPQAQGQYFGPPPVMGMAPQPQYGTSGGAPSSATAYYGDRCRSPPLCYLLRLIHDQAD